MERASGAVVRCSGRRQGRTAAPTAALSHHDGGPRRRAAVLRVHGADAALHGLLSRRCMECADRVCVEMDDRCCGSGVDDKYGWMLGLGGPQAARAICEKNGGAERACAGAARLQHGARVRGHTARRTRPATGRLQEHGVHTFDTLGHTLVTLIHWWTHWSTLKHTRTARARHIRHIGVILLFLRIQDHGDVVNTQMRCSRLSACNYVDWTNHDDPDDVSHFECTAHSVVGLLRLRVLTVCTSSMSTPVPEPTSAATRNFNSEGELRCA